MCVMAGDGLAAVQATVLASPTGCLAPPPINRASQSEFAPCSTAVNSRRFVGKDLAVRTLAFECTHHSPGFPRGCG